MWTSNDHVICVIVSEQLLNEPLVDVVQIIKSVDKVSACMNVRVHMLSSQGDFVVSFQ